MLSVSIDIYRNVYSNVRATNEPSPMLGFLVERKCARKARRLRLAPSIPLVKSDFIFVFEKKRGLSKGEKVA